MYYHKITEYEIKCCMHSHHGVPRAPSSRGELYGHKTLFLDDFPIFFYYPNGTWTHPPTSKLFLDFWNFFNFAKPLSETYACHRQTTHTTSTQSISLIGLETCLVHSVALFTCLHQKRPRVTAARHDSGAAVYME